MQVLWGQVLWFQCKVSTDSNWHASKLRGAFVVSAHPTQLPWVPDGQTALLSGSGT